MVKFRYLMSGKTDLTVSHGIRSKWSSGFLKCEYKFFNMKTTVPVLIGPLIIYTIPIKSLGTVTPLLKSHSSLNINSITQFRAFPNYSGMYLLQSVPNFLCTHLVNTNIKITK